MINVARFNRGPLSAGETRELVLTGDAPFIVSACCFVQNPPPPGFRPCAECSTKTIVEHEVFSLEASFTFWQGKTGRIEITIKDFVGETLILQLQVLPNTSAAPTAMMSAD